MRKISFGSFPLTEIKAEDRKCLDKYLIKTFADNISISDAIRNLSVTKNLMYITPDSLMKSWLGGGAFRNDRTMSSDRESNSIYDQALKRAFYILKEFYKKIKDAPFYKEFVYYPIYVEKINKIDVGGNPETGDQYTEVQMNYSFVILANDLTKGLKIDEIRYDENASLNFLFLFVEFFSGSEFGRSIHSFNKADYEFLVKLYQFVEQSGKDPIHMTMDLYKLIGLIKDAANAKVGSSFEMAATANKEINKLNADNLKKYRGLIRHRLVDILENARGITGPAEARVYREAFIDLMNAIFKSEGLNGLYDGVDSKAELNERYQYVYNTNKYREILNLAGELVKYNELNCKNVITSDPMDFDFKVEHGEYSIETQSSILAQKYQTFFKAYVESISKYLEGVIEIILNDLGISDTIRNAINNQRTSSSQAVQVAEADIDNARSEIDRLRNENAANNRDLVRERNLPRDQRDPAEIRRLENEIRINDNEIRANETLITNRQQELNNLRTLSSMLESLAAGVDSTISDTSSKLYERIKNNVLSAIANDLTFIYDDGKRFFTNEMATEGFIRLDSSHNLLNFDGSGFESVVRDMNSGRIPQTINGEDNPEYFAGEVVAALDSSFDVTASDIITAIRDSIRPAVIDYLKVSGKQLADSLRPTGRSLNPFANMTNNENTVENATLQSLLVAIDSNLTASGKRSFGINDQIQNTLQNEILRNRFIKNVLNNFKKMFTRKQTKKIIEFNKDVSQLHPLIKKLLDKNDGDGKKTCQYFKSFILNFDTCEQLYKIKFLVDTHKFLKGFLRQPPRKLSNPMNRLQAVLFDYLGLKDNPVWVISKANIYLSMPDDLSLTNTSILSKIPKTDLMEVCKITPKDYWNERTMGQVGQFGNKEIAKLHKKIEDLENQIASWKEEKSNLKDNESNKRKNLDKLINNAYKKIDQLEEKIAKTKHEEKPFTPNAFLFGDPNKAEKQELLSDTERQELMKNKEEMKDRLLELNPYDDNDIAKMEKEMEKLKRDTTHPFDFEEDKMDQRRAKDEEESKAFEEFLKLREQKNEQKNNL